MGNVLLVVQGVYGNHVCFHKVFNHFVILGDKQSSYGDNSRKLAGFIVGNIAGVNCFLVDTCSSDSFDSLFGGHLRSQCDKLSCHN